MRKQKAREIPGGKLEGDRMKRKDMEREIWQRIRRAPEWVVDLVLRILRKLERERE